MDIQNSFDRFIKDRQVMQVSSHYIGNLQFVFKKLGQFLASSSLSKRPTGHNN
jgi:hypothetical protein